MTLKLSLFLRTLLCDFPSILLIVIICITNFTTIYLIVNLVCCLFNFYVYAKYAPPQSLLPACPRRRAQAGAKDCGVPSRGPQSLTGTAAGTKKKINKKS